MSDYMDHDDHKDTISIEESEFEEFNLSLLPKDVAAEDLYNLMDKANKTGIISWNDIKEQFDEDYEISPDDEVIEHIINVFEKRGFIVENIPGKLTFAEIVKSNVSFMEGSQESIRSYMNKISKIPVMSKTQMLESSRRISEAYQETSTYALQIPMVAQEVRDLVVSLEGKITSYAKVIDAVGTLDFKRRFEHDEEVRKQDEESKNKLSEENFLDSDDEADEEETPEENTNSGGPYNSEANKYAAEILDEAFAPWSQVFSVLKMNRLGEPNITEDMWDYIINDVSTLTQRIRVEHNLTIRMTDKVLNAYTELKRLDGKIVNPAGRKDRKNIEVVRKILANRKSTKDDKKLQELAGLTDAKFAEILESYRDMSQRVRCDLVTFRQQAEKLKNLQNMWIHLRNYMMTSNLKLVVSLAKDHYTNRGLETSDVIQEGNIGLFKAIDKFDYKKNNAFSTYAVAWISRQIKKAIMEKSTTIRTPSHMFEANYKVRHAAADYIARHGESPSLQQLAKMTGVPVARVRSVTRNIRHQVSIESPVSNNGDDSGSGSTIGDFMSDRSTPSPMAEVHKKMQAIRIDEALSTLDERTELVIRMRMGIGHSAMTLEEIGREFNVTRERIRQIEAKGFRMLSKPLRGRILKAYHHDDTDDDGNEDM